MNKKMFPKIYYYDQDFIDIYNKSLSWIQDKVILQKVADRGKKDKNYYSENCDYIDQMQACMSSFFLVYSNGEYSSTSAIDKFYQLQEESGAIRARYDNNNAIIDLDENEENIGFPIFAWAEYNLYHKTGNKKRISEVLPILDKYYKWIESKFLKENGLYSIDVNKIFYKNSPRVDAYYPIDFNSLQVHNAYCISKLADILNDKNLSLEYKKRFFSLKVKINSLMWSEKDGFYYDLDVNENILEIKTIVGFFPMLSEIPSEDRIERMIFYLKSTNHFGTPNPFPTLSVSEPGFSEDGNGYYGSVYTYMNFFVIKGLEYCGRANIAREFTIRHLYYILDTLMPFNKIKEHIWEAYRPMQEGPAYFDSNKKTYTEKGLICYLALFSISLMIENIIGLTISLPDKTVYWNIPTLEIMGIESLSLKKNQTTIICNKGKRGWEIKMESEKLYYFTINILNKKEKTLPIPSGRCSMLLDKL
ncbi:MGH1-like glycoside hydrolase domain-containing protein [Borreliella burgdorferi]|uniref:MGH1-like glycoside hydrolase domain-containing protein n=1 Tax=Borreliella burgdorferi TaxID=139 RepID=UPI00216670D0|nr:trehalase family glycosidase [Borreliella burgdorferi]MCS2181585.1 hypothetical protein [Borreliella burgdorferi]